MLPQDTTHLIQRPCYQRGSPCQDPTGNWTTWRPPDDRKETKTAVVWSCLPFIWSGHSKRGKKMRQTQWRDGKTTSGNGQAWSSQSPRGQRRTGKMEETGCEIICGAPTTLAVKGLMMMIMMMMMMMHTLLRACSRVTIHPHGLRTHSPIFSPAHPCASPSIHKITIVTVSSSSRSVTVSLG